MEEEKGIISFDFDSTLTQPIWDSDDEMWTSEKNAPNKENIIKLIKLSQQGHKIIIVTSRSPSERKGVEEFVAKHNLPVEEIHTTDGDKGAKLVELGVVMHFDDATQSWDDSQGLFKGKWVKVFHPWDKDKDGKILFYERDQEEYGFLSNFHQASFDLDGQTWPTVEHYYMAMKSENPKYQQEILAAHSPGKAKRLGDSKIGQDNWAKQSLFRTNRGGYQLKPNWDKDKVDVMYRAVKAKFSQNSDLKIALLETGNKELIEDSPSDNFWGAGSSGTGRNELGKILMKVRAEL